MYDFLGISDYAEIVEDEGDYSSPDGKYDFCCQGYKFMNKINENRQENFNLVIEKIEYNNRI
jgi:hypothetical protein